MVYVRPFTTIIYNHGQNAWSVSRTLLKSKILSPTKVGTYPIDGDERFTLDFKIIIIIMLHNIGTHCITNDGL